MTAKWDDSDGRLRGRKQQERRARIWAIDPHCAHCGKLVELNAIPNRGFHLDHRIPLFKGGADTDANLQVLCIGDKGCHEAKTEKDMGHRQRAQFDASGRVVW